MNLVHAIGIGAGIVLHPIHHRPHHLLTPHPVAQHHEMRPAPSFLGRTYPDSPYQTQTIHTNDGRDIVVTYKPYTPAPICTDPNGTEGHCQ